jgi:hypothetical protein
VANPAGSPRRLGSDDLGRVARRARSVVGVMAALTLLLPLPPPCGHAGYGQRADR